MSRLTQSIVLAAAIAASVHIASAQSAPSPTIPGSPLNNANKSESGSINPTANAPLVAPAPARSETNLSMEEAVVIALKRNRDIIAAKLDLKEADYDKVAAEMYPNPVFGYQIGNLVLGRGNLYNTQPQPSYSPASRHPGVFSQTVHSVGISEVIDIWAKRSLRIRAAEQELRYKRLLLEDALREITYAVRSAFAEVLRKRSELEFSKEVLDRYSETVKLSHSRFKAGEISEAEFRKIELEGLKYQNAVIDAELERDLARQSLAALLGFGSIDELPDMFLQDEVGALQRSVSDLTREAIQNRPDLRAIAEGRRYATASLASARREAYPDLTLGVTYVHSEYQVAGDNPNTLGFGASMPVPFFDRNQANIGRAEVGVMRSDNDTVRLTLQIRHEVAEAVRRFQRAESMLALFKEGGMLERAETSLRVAEKSYKAGAVSLLEFLESQRTYLETHDEFLHAQYDRQQSAVDLIHALGKRP